MAKLTIDGSTRLVQAGDLKLARTQTRPLDFARDHIVILDADQCPVAECWPIEREPNGEPRPAVVVAPSSATTATTGGGDRLGRLTDAQREMLERLWAENRNATPDKIGELFEKRAGRTVSVMTVLSYKPGKAS